MLLPVPSFRSHFVTQNDITQRYFVIEHYFSDSLLSAGGIKGDPILGSPVVKIKSNKKTHFSKSLVTLDISEFEEFKILFAEILKRLK